MYYKTSNHHVVVVIAVFAVDVAVVVVIVVDIVVAIVVVVIVGPTLWFFNKIDSVSPFFPPLLSTTKALILPAMSFFLILCNKLACSKCRII